MVFKFMVKLMNAESSHLKDEDYRHEGLVCTVTMPVRENGTGEIMYMQNGVRRSAGARSCNGQPLEKGAEVVIERYENGMAYVHRWEEFTKLSELKQLALNEFRGLTLDSTVRRRVKGRFVCSDSRSSP